MTTYQIAVIPGDGIGKEVTKEALKVLRAIEENDSRLSFHLTTYDWNSEYYLEHGRMMPEDGLEQLERHDAILLGAIGDHRVRDDVSVWGLIMPIRKRFKQYVNFRPVKQLKGIPARVQAPSQQPIDFIVVRENAEGEYSDIGGRLYEETNDEIAIQNTVMTKRGIERISRFAFEWAKNNGKTKVTNATKSNAVIHSMNFWDEIVHQVKGEYSDIHIEDEYIDALCAHFVNRPESFEVVLSSNLFGDILSDLGSALVGGLGISPSANLNPEGEFPSMFEPVHGSAPDIAGKGVANPIAQIWSVSLLLDHIGEKEYAALVMDSIESVLEEGKCLTPDLGGKSTTEEVGNAVTQILSNKLS